MNIIRKGTDSVITTIAFVIAFIWLIPLIWMIGTAFTEPSFSMSLFPKTGFTLKNIVYVWNAVPFKTYYINTLILVTATFIIQIFTSTMAAYALAVMQIIIPNDVLITPNFMTLKDLNLINTKLGIMIPFLGTAFGIFLLRQHFKTIPKSLSEAARIDGANTWQIIWKIYMPCAKPAYLSFGVVSISYHWNNYLWPLIVTNSTQNRTLTVGLALFAKSKEATMQWANVSAATFIIIFPLIVIFFILQKKFINSFISSGIKE